jgi:excisionase family DNA binding protein
VLKIHPKVLERMAKRGEVPALKVGKFWRYRATTLDAWINSRLQSGRRPCRMQTSF